MREILAVKSEMKEVKKEMKEGLKGEIQLVNETAKSALKAAEQERDAARENFAKLSKQLEIFKKKMEAL